MCGIVGYVGDEECTTLLVDGRRKLEYRGYDSAGVAVVHNGIIENHLELKESLQRAGHKFSSETDTEIFAHLIADEEKSGTKLPEAVRAALAKVKGTYALAVMSERSPEMLVVAKNAS